MKAVLIREYNNLNTLGYLVALEDGEVRLKVRTLELPNNGNQKSSSCIPEGKYEVHKIHSMKFGNCFQVMDVPDRTGILFHAGNYASLTEKTDTSGCILPGLTFADMNGDGTIDIIQSTVALNKMLEVLPDKFELIIV